MTLLSILMPNYNYAHFIEGALDSILQTNKSNDFEIIVIDDASTDNSLQVLKKYQNDARVKLFCNSVNKGAVTAFNQGILESKSPYLHFFASDDLHLPGSVDLMISFILKYPNVAIFCSHYAYFSDPASIHVRSPLPCKTLTYFDRLKAKRLFQRSDFWIPGHILVKREIYLQYGLLDLKLGPICDWIINHQIALDHGIGYIPQQLVATREHPRSFSRSLACNEKKQLWLTLLKECRNNPKLKPLAQTGLFRVFGLKSIYKQLIFNPLYWKYTFPILRRELGKRIYKKKTSALGDVLLP